MTAERDSWHFAIEHHETVSPRDLMMNAPCTASVFSRASKRAGHSWGDHVKK